MPRSKERTGGGLWGLVGAALGVLGACGELREEARFEPRVGVLEIVETIPAQGAEATDPLGRVDLCMSAEVDPSALTMFDVTLRSGGLTFDTEQEVQLFSWRAPGSRSELAQERWCPGSVVSLTPASAFQPGLTYRIRLRPALLGWAGEELSTEQEGWIVNDEGELRWFLEFRVAGSPADEEPEEIPELPPGPTLTQLFAPGEIFDPAAGSCGCHQQEGELAHARLDLSTPEIAWSELVLRSGLEPTGYPMVSSGRPSDSYLVHKLLRTDQGEALHGIAGVAMPPEGALDHEELTRIAHWIADGAEL